MAVWPSVKVAFCHVSYKETIVLHQKRKASRFFFYCCLGLFKWNCQATRQCFTLRQDSWSTRQSVEFPESAQKRQYSLQFKAVLSIDFDLSRLTDRSFSVSTTAELLDVLILLRGTGQQTFYQPDADVVWWKWSVEAQVQKEGLWSKAIKCDKGF